VRSRLKEEISDCDVVYSSHLRNSAQHLPREFYQFYTDTRNIVLVVGVVAKLLNFSSVGRKCDTYQRAIFGLR